MDHLVRDEARHEERKRISPFDMAVSANLNRQNRRTPDRVRNPPQGGKLDEATTYSAVRQDDANKHT